MLSNTLKNIAFIVIIIAGTIYIGKSYSEYKLNQENQELVKSYMDLMQNSINSLP